MRLSLRVCVYPSVLLNTEMHFIPNWSNVIHLGEKLRFNLLVDNSSSSSLFVCLFVFLALQPVVGCIFHSPVAGFSLLVFEVS